MRMMAVRSDHVHARRPVAVTSEEDGTDVFLYWPPQKRPSTVYVQASQQ